MRNQLQRLLPKKSFLRGVSVLVGGTAGAQIMSLLAAPLLTRLYTPEDFGLIAVYGSLLAIISVITCLRYELAIPLPEDEGVAANLVMLCLVLVITMSILTGVAILFWGDSIVRILGIPIFSNYIWFLPLGVLLTGFYTVFNHWSIRTKHFGDIAKTKINQAIVMLAIQIAGFKFGAVALLLGQVAGQTAGTFTLAISALKNRAFKHLSLSEMKLGFRRYREFPLYSTWSGLINAIGHQLPPLIFAVFFSAGAAGLYAIAHRLLTMPANLVGGALAQVFLSYGVDSSREGSLGLVYANLQNILIQISLPPSLFIILVGPELFAIVLGEEWREAGVFAQWLSISAFFGFVVSPLSQIFTILEKEKTGMFLQIILFLFRLTGILIGIMLDSLLYSVMLFSLGGGLGYIVYIYYGAKLAGCEKGKISAGVFSGIIKSTLIIIPFIIGYLSELEWLFCTLGSLSIVFYILQIRTSFRSWLA